MMRSGKIKFFAAALAITIAVVSTIMLLGIQINFNQPNKAIKITAPIVTLGLVAILIVYKIVRKQVKTNRLVSTMKSDRLRPYVTIFFTYFDVMCICGILSGLCGIICGILNKAYTRFRFETLPNWAYMLSRMAIVFAIYILCLLVFEIGCMIAFRFQTGVKKEKKSEEGVNK